MIQSISADSVLLTHCQDRFGATNWRRGLPRSLPDALSQSERERGRGEKSVDESGILLPLPPSIGRQSHQAANEQRHGRRLGNFLDRKTVESPWER